MSAITTHILDLSTGRPAAGVVVTLERAQAGAIEGAREWKPIGRGATDADGRLRTLVPAGTVAAPGSYRLVFATGAYFARLGARAFHPHVTVEFEVAGEPHYHVPLLLSPFGYSTYRGS
jgi:5-hydroxyisourate hydrolase